MKKPILSMWMVLLLIFTVLPMTANAANGVEINETNFPDAVFRQYLRQYDTNCDGSLGTEEIAVVKSINLYEYRNIEDVKGVEYFTALTDLYCPNNKLTSLDVSKNTALTYLTCYDNQLTILDVSNNTKLEDLSCSYNQLANLDVSKNVALETLRCGDNPLTNLDVSKNTKLGYLNCDNNQLTNLDVSKNVVLETLGCSHNQLINLDVSKNTKLGDLYCFNNQLTNLDVSKNVALTSLMCFVNPLTSLDVSNNTKLEDLDCSNNQLTSVDISKHIALRRLSCSNNQLTSVDISKNTALTSLDCSNNQLTSLDISKNVALTDLRCSNNQLTSLDVSKNNALRYLICGYNRLTSLDLNKKMTQYLSVNSQNSSLEVKKTSDGWAVDLATLVGAENLNKVEIKPEQGWQYDAATGTAAYTGENMPAELIYYYNGNNLPAETMNVTVKLIKIDGVQQCVVMKQGAEEAYVSGAVYPTTQYTTGYAKMENINGTMQMPLRYIAEVNDLVVVYDENTQKTKVINPVSKEYLLITPGSKTVTKHGADGTLISSSEAPLAFTMQNSVTMGPLRYTCEALGLTVSYQETSHGNYVVVSPESKTSTQAIEKIEEAYQLGL